MIPDSSMALEEALYERLDPTVRRELWLRRWRGWAAVLAVAALAAMGLRLLEERTGLGARGLWVLLTLATGVAAVLVHRMVERHAPDLRALARVIEKTQPELRALLLTAVAEATAPLDGQLGYLQQEVIREAVRQADPRRWRQAIPAHRLWGMALAAAAGGAVFVAMVAGALLPELPALLPDHYGLTVTPGDTEAERGTAVVVLARFARNVPSHVTLVMHPAGQPVARLEMTKNLGDPVFGAVTPPLTESADYQIEYAGHRSRRFHIEAFANPEVDRVDARIVYPAQPALPAREVADARKLSVAEGARVTLTFHLTRPVAEAQLVSEEGAALRLAPSGKRRDLQTITFDPDRTARYDLRLVDDRKRSSHAAAGVSIEVRGNTPPRIALSFPGRDVRVSPLEEVTLEAKLSDDVGLASYGASYSLNDRKEREVRLGGGGERSVTAQLMVPLETLGAAPDDLLSYYFWAEDVAPDGTRRRVSSDMYFAEVRPFEEHFREGAAPGGGASAGGGNQGDDLARREKELVNATWRLEREAREGAVAEALRGDVEVVRKGQDEVKKAAEALRLEPQGREVSGALDEALTAMGQAATRLGEALGGAPAAGLGRARESEQAAYAALLRMRARDHQVARGRGNGQGGSAAEGRDQALDELELKQKDSRYETRSEAEAQDQPGREDRQVLSRLRELAQRQKALTDRLKELQLALQQAKPAEREELEQRLKRLKEEQQDMVGDLDELLQRLERPENRSRLAEARSELESTRSRAGEASEALARGETARAVGAGTRAERALDKVREQLQRQVSRGFGDEMRALRAEARRLAQQEATLGEAVRKGAAPAPAGRKGAGAAPGPTENRRLAEAMRAQRGSLSALLERMRKVTEDAEPSAPLLSRKLYDAFRKAKLDGVEHGVDRLGELLDQNQAAQAAAEEPRVARSLSDLDQGVGEAARGVVGDESEALRLARSELAGLLDQARRPAPGTPGAPAKGEGQGEGQGQAQPQGQGQAQGQAQAQGQRQGQARGQGQGQGQRPGQGQPGGRGAGGGQGGERGAAPSAIIGEGYRNFSDRLRDVAELLADPSLRDDAARVLERARAMRADFKRHSEAPQWALFETEVVRPLAELHDRVAEELRRLSPEQDKLAPIDRDPVPPRFTDLVRRYYKSLAGE
jgi:hypothetical protein